MISPDVDRASSPDAESASARRRARALRVVSDGPMADDGTHDVFSAPWARGDVEDGEDSSREGGGHVDLRVGQGESRTRFGAYVERTNAEVQ